MNQSYTPHFTLPQAIFYIVLSLLVFTLFFAVPAYSQVLIWNETFTLPNNTTSDAGATAWTRTKVPTTDYAKVLSNQFRVRDTDGEVVWTSEAIDITGFAGVDITADLIGDFHCDNGSDYFNFYYNLDGAGETLFPVNGSNSGKTSVTAAVTGLMGGSSVVITVKISNNQNNETPRLDNVRVFEHIPPVVGSTACAANDILALPFSYTGTTVGFGNNSTGGCKSKYTATSGTGEDYFFKYTSTGNEYLTFYLTGTNAGNKTELSIFTAPSGCGAALSCYENATYNGTFPGGITAPSGESDALGRSVYLGPAGDYYFKIDANSGASGPFTLTIDPYSPGVTNDECVGASQVTTSPVHYRMDNISYTKGPNDPPGALFCASKVENNLWLKITSDAVGTDIDITLTNISADTSDNITSNEGWQFGILDGTCVTGPWSSIDCHQDVTGLTTYSASFTPAPSTTYYFVMDGYAASFVEFDIEATNVVILPIELSSFEAEADQNSVSLNWTTGSEKNNDYFTIERSKNGVDFEPAGQVTAIGNSTIPTHYQLTDDEPYYGTSYYRLKQTDIDGQFTYSKMITAYIEEPADVFEVYPNPVKPDSPINVDLEHFEDEEVLVVLTDMIGRIHYSKVRMVDQHNGFIEAIDTENRLNSGIYFITATSKNDSYMKKIIVN